MTGFCSLQTDAFKALGDVESNPQTLGPRIEYHEETQTNEKHVSGNMQLTGSVVKKEHCSKLSALP